MIKKYVIVTLKWSIYLGLFTISCTTFKNLGSYSLMTYTTSKLIVLRTSLNYLLIISLKYWSLSYIFLFEAPNANIYKNILTFSKILILLDVFNLCWLSNSKWRLWNVIASILNMFIDHFQCSCKISFNHRILVLYETIHDSL